MIREMLTSQRNEELEEAISNRFVISERFGMSQSVNRIIKASRAVDGKYTKRFGEGAAGYKTGNPNHLCDWFETACRWYVLLRSEKKKCLTPIHSRVMSSTIVRCVR